MTHESKTAKPFTDFPRLNIFPWIFLNST